MIEPDQKTTLREFREYFDMSCESSREIAARIGVVQWTIGDWLAGKSQPKTKSLAKLRRFLDNEAKRPAQGDGIRPIEPVPYKIIRPLQQVRYARLCPFCRKTRGKIRKLGADSFQGVCPKCGATGPKREGHQEALRAWNGREQTDSEKPGPKQSRSGCNACSGDEKLAGLQNFSLSSFFGC